MLLGARTQYAIEKRVFDKAGNLLGYIVDLEGKKEYINRSESYYGTRNGWIKNVKIVNESDFSIRGINGFKLRDLPSISEEEMPQEMSNWSYLYRPFSIVDFISYRFDGDTPYITNIYVDYLSEKITWFGRYGSTGFLIGIVVRNVSSFPCKIEDIFVKPNETHFISFIKLINNLDYYTGVIDGLCMDHSVKDKFKFFFGNRDRFKENDLSYWLLYRFQVDTEKIARNKIEIKKFLDRGSSYNLYLNECDTIVKSNLKEMLYYLNSPDFNKYKEEYESRLISTTARKTSKFIERLKDNLNIYNFGSRK